MENLNLTKGPFTKYERTLFFEREEGILIVPPGAEYKTICLNRSEILAARKEAFMIRDGLDLDLRKNERNATCMRCKCNQETDGVFLLPICEMAHGFVCETCARVLGENNKILCSAKWGCYRDDLLDDLYKSVFRKKEIIYSTDGMAEKAAFVDSWTPARSNIQPERILLLTSGTRVTLGNVAISDILFFKLLEKTNVSVKENLSIFGHRGNLNCIRKELGENAIDIFLEDVTNPLSFKSEARFLENIRKIPGNSIACEIGIVFIHENIHFCILPKLKEIGILRPDCEIERMRESGSTCSLRLTVKEKKYMLEIGKMENKGICIGKVDKMYLDGYGILILPKMNLPDNNSINLTIIGNREDYVSQLFQEPDNSIWIGRLSGLYLRKKGDGLRNNENKSIVVGKIEKRKPSVYAINTLTKTKQHHPNSHLMLHWFDIQFRHFLSSATLARLKSKLRKGQGYLKTLLK